MGRSPDGSRSRLFFKFQSSENIDAITNAFPEVPWMFLFREPVEVMMSRMGAQRIGMDATHDEVSLKLGRVKTRQKNPADQQTKEATTADYLATLCKKAITAASEHPGQGMMVEYTHLPAVVYDYMLPVHFNVELDKTELEALTAATNVYSKVADADQHGGLTTFHDDKSDKQSAASMLVKLSTVRTCPCIDRMSTQKRTYRWLWYAVTQMKCAYASNNCELQVVTLQLTHVLLRNRLTQCLNSTTMRMAPNASMFSHGPWTHADGVARDAVLAATAAITTVIAQFLTNKHHKQTHVKYHACLARPTVHQQTQHATLKQQKQMLAS
eukprot:17695-Heterococcus_DN1.PRE.2